MRRRRRAALFLLLMLAFPLAGCWDRREVEELAFVLALGIDKGKSATYAITAMIALPSKLAGGGGNGGGGGGGGGDEKPYMLVTVEAHTVAGAIAVIDSSIDRRATLIHTKALFVGEDLAKVSGLRAMDELTRFRQTRRTIFYIVTEGQAADYLDKMQPKMEKDPNRFIELMTYGFRYTGMIPAKSQIHDFVTKADTGYTAPLTYYAALRGEEESGGEGGGEKGEQGNFVAGDLPKKGGPNVELIGGAAFRGDKMVGVLSGEEMRHVLMLQDTFRNGQISLKDPAKPDLYVSLEVNRGRPTRLSVDLSNPGRPRINALVTLEAEILAIQSEIDYTDPERQRELEQALERDVKQSMEEMLRKTQTWNADVVGFGRHVVKQFPTVADWEAYGWRDRYKDAEIVVDVRASLRRFGLQLSPPDTPDRKGG